MSNTFTVTAAKDLMGVGGISGGDYTVNWSLFIPWLSPGEIAGLDPVAISYEGFDVSHSWFDSSYFVDMPPGFLLAMRSFNISTSGIGIHAPPLASVISDTPTELTLRFDFNLIYEGSGSAPIEAIRASYDWLIPNHGFYLGAYVDKMSATEFPSATTVRSGFSIYDETGSVVVATGEPVLLTEVGSSARYFLFPFTVGGFVPPPTQFWTNFHACVEDV